MSILQFPELWGLARHPTQLYEWLAAGVALVLLLKWKRFFAYEQGLAFLAAFVVSGGVCFSGSILADMERKSPAMNMIGSGVMLLSFSVFFITFAYVFKNMADDTDSQSTPKRRYRKRKKYDD
ncbi:hypothetical protein [Kingella negevensis]|uniref:hypothetical protein n=1 Tax=Kingella negevensis TaxID=1522312 RepID=UPI001FD81194|nr:hypothetical protein [Kingella negevensis]WII90118.1 hypothetical protein QEO93_06400 [Kingella negevensis]